MKKIIFMTCFLLSSSVNAALEYPGGFKISSIHMANPTNFHFRVAQKATDDGWHCHGGPKNPAWSYINENDPGSKGMMAALLSAYAADKTVALVTEGVDTPAGRFCHIVEFSVSD
ncbi:hypothetical protein HKW97_17825 [Pseudomonas luteola]